MFNLILFGGGRWARVIAGVLCDILPEEHKIFWVSKHGYDDLTKWVRERNKNQIILLKDDAGAWDNNIHASVIATAPHSHAGYAEKSIARGIPTFIEKPFALNMIEATHLLDLAKKSGCVSGVNLVFMYADYLHDFARLLADKTLASIEIVWHDAKLEIRYGEEKRPDFYTSIPHDMFPHIWSILKILKPEMRFELQDVVYSASGAVSIQGNDQSTSINISLSRRGGERIRQVKVNGGEWVLDFTQEPGFILHQNVKTQNHWQGKTPLVQSLTEFLNIAKTPLDSAYWPLALDKCIETVALSDRVQTLLEVSQNQVMDAMAVSEEELINNHTNLLIDMFLPRAGLEGKKPPILTDEQRKDFAAKAMSLYSIKKVGG